MQITSNGNLNTFQAINVTVAELIDYFGKLITIECNGILPRSQHAQTAMVLGCAGTLLSTALGWRMQKKLYSISSNLRYDGLSES